MAVSFEDLEQSNSKVNRVAKPFWALGVDKPENEKSVLNWLNGEITFLDKEAEERLRTNQKHLALYKGIQYESQETSRQSTRDSSNDKKNAIDKIVANHLFDLTEHRVSKQVKYRPAVAIMPTNDEFEDKISAKACKSLLDHIWYNERFDSDLLPEMVRLTAIEGEAYFWISWDKDKGDLHKDFEAAKKKPVLDPNGKPMVDDAGRPVKIDQPVYNGDVAYECVMADDIRLPKKLKFKDVEYCFRKRVMTIEEARLRYPEKAGEIKASRGVQIYEFDTMTTRTLDNEVLIWEFYHKHTKPLAKGRHIVFTSDTIIINQELPYSHGELPFERLTDIDVPGEVHGRSFFETVKALTAAYNNATNMIIRNQVLVSHPKWMMPAGAAKLDQLGNDITIVQYKGPVPPTLVQCQPTPAELFNFRDKLKEEFQQIAGVFSVSRGEPPPGIKAGVALQFLNEQESERYNNTILKLNEFLQKVAIKTLAVCGDYYDESDERMIRVLGKNNAYMTKFFNAADLSKDYDIRIQNASALPQSKAARLQTLLDLSERFPNEVTGKQVLDMIDLAQSEKFVDIATVAVRTAEAEVEDLLDGKDVPPPEDYEDLITKWSVYSRQPQEYAFKREIKPEIRKKFLDYLAALEYLMVEKAAKNDTFAQALAGLTNFPLVFTLPPKPVAPPAPQEQAPPMPPEGFQPEALDVANPDLAGAMPQEMAAPMAPSLETQQQAIPIAPTSAV